MPSDSINPTKVSPQVTVIYGCGQQITGQRLASEILINGLVERGWQVYVIQTPLFDRSEQYKRGERLRKQIKLGLNLIAAWYKGLRMALKSEPIVVNLGQTRFAIIRDGLPLLVRRTLKRDQRTIISLHGSLFTNWSIQSFEARFLRTITQAVSFITVLGPRQKKQLGELGLDVKKIIHLDNTCLLPAITKQQYLDKQAIQPIKVLYLSNLLETKGYVEFVESIRQLATQDKIPITSTLCGSIMLMDSDTRFQNRIEAANWIKQQIDSINQSKNVRMRWINGAAGQVKENLFRDAHIFVLPSFYKVEAQPLAILEALASGCAVITSTAGEIPTMVSEQTAILLDEISATTIAEAIITLQSDPNKRRQLALNGLTLFKDRFTLAKHIDRWEILLLSIH